MDLLVLPMVFHKTVVSSNLLMFTSVVHGLSCGLRKLRRYDTVNVDLI